MGLILRGYRARDLYGILVDSGIDTALIGFIIAVAAPFAWVLIAERIPQGFFELITGLVTAALRCCLL